MSRRFNVRFHARTGLTWRSWLIVLFLQLKNLSALHGNSVNLRLSRIFVVGVRPIVDDFSTFLRCIETTVILGCNISKTKYTVRVTCTCMLS